MATPQNIYDPKRVDIDRLAGLIKKLSPAQLEALEIRLNPDAMKQLEASRKDIERGDTVPLDEW